MNNKKDSLGDRMKGYENVTRNFATKRTPLIIRLDGKAFHTFTRANNCKKPFDGRLVSAMVNSAKDVASSMQGFKVAYIQSDEVTFLLTDYEDIKTQGWFNYNLSKIISISAAMMSVSFVKHYCGIGFKGILPVFDARAFNVPKDDVVNNFLWRAKDYERNSLSMYCQSLFSHKELQNKNKQDMHNMLHDIGKNWTTDLSDIEKNGTFLINDKDNGFIVRNDILPNYDYVNKVIDEFI